MIYEIPEFTSEEFFKKNSECALLIPTLNEGNRIIDELNRLKNKGIPSLVDIILLDGGTTDGSIAISFLNEIGVRILITVKEKGQGCAYRAGFSKVLDDCYKWVVTVDGNNKDSVEQVMEFVSLLSDGYDFVQGSRFLKGGGHKNTPLARFLAIKLFSNPLLSIASGFNYTETMCAFRGFNVSIFSDERLAIFRNIFTTWELQWYLAVRIPRLGYSVKEIPTKRVYPASGQVPTKINLIGNIRIVLQLIKVAIGLYNPKL